MVPKECQSVSDLEVVDRVRAGETGLYELLMRRYNQRLYRTIRSVLTDETEAEDVLQEAWVRAYEHLDQFRGLALFATWLTRIAFHEALARSRKGKRWTQIEDQSGEVIAEVNRRQTTSTTPETEAIRGQLGQMLEAAVDALPERYRSVFVLREVEQLSTTETADCLGLSEEAVKTRLHRSRALLRRDLESRIGPAIAEAYSFLGARCDRTVARVLKRIGA
ncbi:MAG TPA: RNA polymerase sigma factor [Bryobacteraceae bacterium]|nr:RNA polymerase sigma factor [Bryobacteraceae bacterium]